VPRKRTEICIVCNAHKPGKGKICDHCRYQRRKAWYKEYNHKYARAIGRRAYTDRARAIKTYGASCSQCGWREEPGVLQVDHVDCNRHNHDIHNLRVLCPNCHYVRHFKDRTSSWRNFRIELSKNNTTFQHPPN
jgi:predicted HNH restriction endonuclease